MRRFSFVALALMVVLCSVCSAANYTQPKKIADYLYYMEYTDYTPNLKTGDNIKPGFYCSGVRNGNFHGRNLDLDYCDVPEFVVKMKAGKDRFASIGICAIMTAKQAQFDKITPEELAAMPNITFDGINENGVVAQHNVAPAWDLNFKTLRGTNPGKPRIHAITTVRYVLDHAKSAKHAIELLSNMDIYGGYGGWGLHMLISDPKESYVVECIEGKLVAKPQKIMTNFYTNFGEVIPEQKVVGRVYKNFPELTPSACGVERYEILRDHYAEGNTLEGMTRLMRRVQYSQAYMPETSPFWYTEYTEPNLGLTIDNKPADFEQAVQKQYEVFKMKDRNYFPDNFWITWSTSIYNLQEKTLRLYVQEDYDHHYDFSLK